MVVYCRSEAASLDTAMVEKVNGAGFGSIPFCVLSPICEETCEKTGGDVIGSVVF